MIQSDAPVGMGDEGRGVSEKTSSLNALRKGKGRISRSTGKLEGPVEESLNNGAADHWRPSLLS